MAGKRSLILVTGSHRSGSSWVGKMLALSEQVVYHSEPFNPAFRPYGPISYWFEYFPPDLEEDHYILDYLRQQTKLNPIRSTLTAIAALRHQSIRVWLKDQLCLLNHTFHPGRIALFKDPIALMSAPMIASSLGAKVLVVIRNPFAFVASLKVKKWHFPFRHFVQQEKLLSGPLADFRSEILHASEENPDIIDQGILLWNIFHSVIAGYRRNNDWIFVRHEDLSQDPVPAFQGLFEQLGLDFTADISSTIAGFSESDQGEIRRNSKDNLHSWKTRLSSAEIERIHIGTKEIYAAFYPEGIIPQET